MDKDFIFEAVSTLIKFAIIVSLIAGICFAFYAFGDWYIHRPPAPLRYVTNNRGWHGDCQVQLWYDRDVKWDSDALIIREMTESEYAQYCYDR